MYGAKKNIRILGHGLLSNLGLPIWSESAIWSMLAVYPFVSLPSVLAKGYAAGIPQIADPDQVGKPRFNKSSCPRIEIFDYRCLNMISGIVNLLSKYFQILFLFQNLYGAKKNIRILGHGLLSNLGLPTWSGYAIWCMQAAYPFVSLPSVLAVFIREKSHMLCKKLLRS